MSFQPGAMVYTQSFGSRPENVEVPTIQTRAPTSNDVNFPIGKRWIDTVGGDEWVLTSQSSIGGVLVSDWSQGGNDEATTTEFGIVQLATLTELQNGNAPAGAYVPTSNDVATVIAGIVVGAVPPATETQAGIAEIATQVETDAGTDDTRIVTPLKLANFVGSGGSPGSFTDLTATGTVTFTGATGGINMTSATASDFGTTGAGIDLTLSSAAGRVVINGEEAAADAVRILSAAGGLDANVALQMNLDSSQAAATAVRIVASDVAGGIDVDAGTGGITIDSTGVISIDAAAASNFTVTGAFDNTFSSTAGSINISGGEAAADAINIDAAAGGLDVDVALQMNLDSSQASNTAVRINASAVTGGIDIDAGSGGIAVDTTGAFSIDGAAASNVTVTGAGIDLLLNSVLGSVLVESTENAALAIRLHANGGTSETIQIHADQGTAATSLDLLSDVGGITLRGGLATADAINITATNAAGGIDIDAGTAGFIVDTTGAISLDSAAASNFTVTGAFDLTLNSTAGSVVITGAEAAADAVQINATTALGGVDINAGTGGATLDSAGAFSIDGNAASNVTVTGAGFDLLLNSVLGSVLVESTENAALAIRLHADGGTSETIQIHSDQGTGVASVGLLSDVGGITVRATGLASADAINLEAAAGGIDMDSVLQTVITSSQAASTAIQLTASDAAGGINLTSGTGNVNITGGHLAIASVAKTLLVNGGAVTDFIGTGVLTAGTQTILNTNIATGDVILIARTGVAASTTLGELTYTINNATSIVFESRIVGTPGTVQTGDVSTFAYFIVRPT